MVKLTPKASLFLATPVRSKLSVTGKYCTHLFNYRSIFSTIDDRLLIYSPPIFVFISI